MVRIIQTVDLKDSRRRMGKLNHEKFQNSYSSENMTRVYKTRRMQQVKNLTCIGKMRN
jgi:hypothetical protein